MKSASAIAVVALLLFAGTAMAAPPAPTITEPAVDGQLVQPEDVHMVASAPENPADDSCTDWEILTSDRSQVLWQAHCVTGALAVHIHLGDGDFVTSGGGLAFGSTYMLRARFHGSDSSIGPWSYRRFDTYPPSSPGGGIPWTPLEPGYVIDEVAGGLQLPMNIAFVPNPGSGPKDPVLYLTELYGTIKVITRDGSIGDYATGLLNYNPTGDFPGSGAGGLTGIVVDPGTGDVFASMVHDPDPSPLVGDLYGRVVRFHSEDGGLTASAGTVILDMPGESQPFSHQISNLTIGPDDGKLYVHMGDGFDPTTSTNLNSFRGKILRVNLDGSPAGANGLYDPSDGITPKDYVYAYGFRNPFGGAWRASNGAHYEVENGPSVDRLARVVEGMNYTYDGTNPSMLVGALYNWDPAHAPTNIAFTEPQTFGGSGFPAAQMDHAFVAESGSTWATGPQLLGKRIVEFAPDPETGEIGGHPHTLVEYTGTGKATAAGLAAGPGGLYFTELYRDQGFTSAIDPGARLLRIRYGPPVMPTLRETIPASPSGDNKPSVLGSAQFSSAVTLFSDPGCQTPVATGTSEELASSGIPVPVPDNSTTTLYARDSVAGVASACTIDPLTYVEQSPLGALAKHMNLKAAVRRCKKHHRGKNRKRCIKRVKRKARRL
ncbi:MAG TPA: PQQ-dependent sugar dehydrogenase [Solirubrobacterales bacterium]|jgi:glucose/arabinose dehydrogenase